MFMNENFKVHSSCFIDININFLCRISTINFKEISDIGDVRPNID